MNETKNEIVEDLRSAYDKGFQCGVIRGKTLSGFEVSVSQRESLNEIRKEQESIIQKYEQPFTPDHLVSEFGFERVGDGKQMEYIKYDNGLRLLGIHSVGNGTAWIERYDEGQSVGEIPIIIPSTLSSMKIILESVMGENLKIKEK